MSSPTSVGVSIGLYLLTVCILKWSVQRPVAVPAWVAGAHNLVLCAGSLIMFCGTLIESIRV